MRHKRKPNYELLKDVYAIVGGIPAKVFDLDQIVTKEGASLTCGTVACAAGWIAHHPKLQAAGLSIKAGFPHSLAFNGVHAFYADVLADVFQIRSSDAVNLFGMRRYSAFDKDLLAAGHLSDKKLFLARVKTFLRNAGQLQ